MLRYGHVMRPKAWLQQPVLPYMHPIRCGVERWPRKESVFTGKVNVHRVHPTLQSPTGLTVMSCGVLLVFSVPSITSSLELVDLTVAP